jgi:hypothetical protein
MNSSRRAAIETRRRNREAAARQASNAARNPRQSAKSARTRAPAARQAASSHPTEQTQGRGGSVDSGRCSESRAVLSLGPAGLRLEPTEADATLARLAELWREYDALTGREWHCNRALDLRAAIRALLGSR